MSAIPKTFTQELTRGENLNLRFLYSDVNGDEVDLTQHLIEVYIYEKGNNTPYVFPAASDVFPSPQERNIIVALNTLQTATLPTGVLELRLKLTDPVGGIEMLPDKGHVKLKVKTADPV